MAGFARGVEQGTLARDATLGIGDGAILLAPAGGWQQDIGTGPLGFVLNIIWFVLGGWYIALSHLLIAFAEAITIVGIPFGIACMRMAGLALVPFGKSIVTIEELARLRQPYTLVIPALGTPRS